MKDFNEISTLGDYDQLNAYDYPMVLMNQFLNDQMTMKSVKETLIDNEALSPSERYSLTEKLKDEWAGESKLGRAVIGVLTNPWVWLSVAISPPAARGLKATGNIFGRNVNQMASDVGDNLEALQSLGFHHFHTMSTGTRSATILRLAKEQMENISLEADAVIAPAMESWAKKLSTKYNVEIKGSDLARGRVPKQVKPEYDEGRRMLYAALERRDLATDKNVRTIFSIDEAGGFTETQAFTPQLMSTKNMSDNLERLGLKDVARSFRKGFDDRYARLLLKEDKYKRGIIELDREKLDRIFGGFQGEKIVSGKRVARGNMLFNKNAVEKVNTTSRGVETVETLLGADAAYLYKTGKINRDQLERFLEVSFVEPFKNKRYMPQNVLQPLVNHPDRKIKISGIHNAETTKQMAEYSNELKIANGYGATDEATRKSNLIARSANQQLLDPEDIAYFGKEAARVGDDDLTQQLRNLQRRSVSVAKNAKRNGRNAILVNPMDPFKSYDRYMRNTGEIYAYHIAGNGSLKDPLFKTLLANRRDSVDELVTKGKDKLQWGRGNTNKDGSISQWELGKDINELKAPKGGWSVADFLEREHTLLGAYGNAQAQDVITDVMLPRMANRLSIKHTTTLQALYSVKEMAGDFARSSFGKSIRKHAGSMGNKFIDNMEEFSRIKLADGMTGRNVHENVANWLYVTHLGINMGSVMLNLTQPFLHAAMWGDLPSLAKGYGLAARDMFKYHNKRIKRHGFGRISNEQRGRLLEETVEHIDSSIPGGNLLGIEDDVFKNFDDTIIASTATEKPGLFRFGTQQLPMKFFEKAEWMNRMVTAHMYDDIVRNTVGKKAFAKGTPEYYRRLEDVKRVVDETQFGGTSLNQPMLFQGVREHAGLAGRIGDLPTARQFLTFPTRAFTSWFKTSQQIAEGRRFVRGTNIEIPQFLGRYTAPVADLARSMGIASVLYEGSKEMLGADMTRGFSAQAYFEVLPLTELTERQGKPRAFGTLPTPPVVDIVWNMFQDSGGRADAFARLLPGGLAVSRLVSSAPQFDSGFMFGLPSAMQKRYVDWNNPLEDRPGYYPVFKGDGSFIGYEKGSSLLLKGMGMDLGASKEAGAYDGYNLKQIQLHREFRARKLRALHANDLAEVEKIDREYGIKFKHPDTGQPYPLTVTKNQLKQYRENRSKSRTERIFDQLPKSEKPLYQQMFGQQAARMGMPGSVAFNPDLTSASKRSEFFNRNYNVTENLTPEIKAYINKMMREQGEEELYGETPYMGYKGYGK